MLGSDPDHTVNAIKIKTMPSILSIRTSLLVGRSMKKNDQIQPGRSSAPSFPPVRTSPSAVPQPHRPPHKYNPDKVPPSQPHPHASARRPPPDKKPLESQATARGKSQENAMKQHGT